MNGRAIPGAYLFRLYVCDKEMSWPRHIGETHQPDWVYVQDSEKFRLTNVIPEQIIFVSRGITVVMLVWYFSKRLSQVWDSLNRLMAVEGDMNSEQEYAFDTVTFVTVRMKVSCMWCECLVIHWHVTVLWACCEVLRRRNRDFESSWQGCRVAGQSWTRRLWDIANRLPDSAASRLRGLESPSVFCLVLSWFIGRGRGGAAGDGEVRSAGDGQEETRERTFVRLPKPEECGGALVPHRVPQLSFWKGWGMRWFMKKLNIIWNGKGKSMK